MECIIAKIFGSEAQKEAAIELFMKTHGGRSFLHGHLFGDNVHEFLAPCIYEGEGEMLGMAFFKSLVKEHGKAYFEPIGKALQQHEHRRLQPAEPGPRCGSCAASCGAYAKWSLGQQVPAAAIASTVPGIDPQLAEHVEFALDLCQQHAGGDQRRDAQASAQAGRPPVPDGRAVAARPGHVVMLVTALWGHGKKNEVVDRRGRHPLPGPAPQADRRAAERPLLQRRRASWPT